MSAPVDKICPACGAAELDGAVAVPDHEYGLDYLARYARCSACASWSQQPMPGADALGTFYPADYHSMGGGGALHRLRHDMRLRRLAPMLDGDGALLDYGCGDGSFLVRAAERLPGRPYVGFEIAARPEVRSLAGGAVTVVRGDLPALLEHLPPCRLITMNHVIEHLPDPLATVSALRERLLPGGRFEGQTPASDSLEHRVFGARWSGFHAPRHTVVFSRRGLEQLLSRAGFASIAVTPAFNPAAAAVSLASLAHGARGGTIRRGGARWLVCLGLAAALAPIDRFSGAPGIVDFVARA